MTSGDEPLYTMEDIVTIQPVSSTPAVSIQPVVSLQPAVAAALEPPPPQAPARIQQNVTSLTIEGAGAGILERVDALKDATFSNMVRGGDAVIQGIKAASVLSNSATEDLAFTLLDAVVNDAPTISNALRKAAYNPDALRYDMNASYTQIRRHFQEQMREGLHVPDYNAPVQFNALEVAFADNPVEKAKLITQPKEGSVQAEADKIAQAMQQVNQA